MLFVLLFIASVVGFATYCFLPVLRFRRLTNRAHRAIERRQFDTAHEIFQRIARLADRQSDKTAQRAFRFVAVQGLGAVYRERNDFADAVEQFEEARSLLAAGVEMPPLVVAQVECELAVSYFGLAQDAKGRQALARLESFCRSLSEADLAPTLNELCLMAGGAAASNQNRLAERVLTLIIELAQESTAPVNAIIVARSKINLARVHVLEGRYASARDLLGPVVNQDDRQPLLDHHTRMDAWSALAATILMLGDLEGSIAYHQRWLDATASTGAGDVDVSNAEMSLAGALFQYGQYDDARRYARQAYQRKARFLTWDDFQMRSTGLQWLPILMQQGDYRQVGDLLTHLENCPATRAIHDGTLLPATKLFRGIYLADLQADEAAIESFRDAVATYKQIHGNDANGPNDYLLSLASILLKTGHHAEAADHVQRVEQNVQSREDLGFLVWADLGCIRAELALAVNDFAGAAEHAKASISRLDGRVLPTQTMLAYDQFLKGRALAGQGNHSNALECFATSESLRKESQSTDHPKFNPLYRAWAQTLRDVGEDETADEYQQKADLVQEQCRKLLQSASSDSTQEASSNPYAPPLR